MEDVEAPQISKQSPWMALLRNVGLALVMFTGGGVGSYASMQEMAKDEAVFRYEVKEALKGIEKRLGGMDDRLRELEEDDES